jgi:Carbohydrate family 9 binding domain-like
MLMSLVPSRFLFRIAFPCRYVKAIPREDEDRLLDLPDGCRLDNFAVMDGQRNFADVRLAWNDLGLALQVEVRGKDQEPQGDASRPRGSDGVTLWLDTRDARTSHRASRYCHQFHFLPTGGGADHDEPLCAQTKINRALQDAPLASASGVPFRCQRRKGGYVLEAFLPAAVLNGFDPEQNPRLGFYYAVRDVERGDQVLSVGAEFPYWEDPSLWSVLELVRV